MDKTLNISQLANISRLTTEFSKLGNEYIFTHLTEADKFHLGSLGPFCVDGYTWLLCLNGHIDIDINLQQYTMESQSLLFTSPNTMAEIRHIDWTGLDCYLLVISHDFIRDINIDINLLQYAGIGQYAGKISPVISLTPSDTHMLRCYFELIHANTYANTDDKFIRSISRNLVTAQLYQMIYLAKKHLEKFETAQTPSAQTSRRINYIRQFIALLQTHHATERTIGFYAQRLFISPKYLSLIIKEQTGRSAADWIDEFVILEAKNLLRFSDKNIQEIAYALNFTSQSAFGKYFRRITGLSPSEYRS